MKKAKEWLKEKLNEEQYQRAMELMEYQGKLDRLEEKYLSFQKALSKSFQWCHTPKYKGDWEEQDYWYAIYYGKNPAVMPWKKKEEIIGIHIKMYPEFNGKRVKLNDRFETEHIWSPELAIKNNNRWIPELVEQPKEQSLAELEDLKDIPQEIKVRVGTTIFEYELKHQSKWIKIESEEDLPKLKIGEIIHCFIKSSDYENVGMGMFSQITNSFLTHFHNHYENVTHYQPIQKPEPPKF